MAKSAKKTVKKRSKKCEASKKRTRSASAVKTDGGGRPGLFEPEFCDRAERYCSRFAATDKDLAELLEVSQRTIAEWKSKYPKFKAAIKRGKNFASEHIEYNLRQLAMPHDEVQEEKELRGRGKNRKLVTVKKKVKKNVVDVTAAIRILAADDPRFRTGVNIGGQKDNPLNLTDIVALMTGKKEDGK